MAITSIKTGSSFKNLTKYNDFLAGNTAFQPTAYESIATVTVGAGGASSVSFSSIPSGYQHLQIRGIARANRSTYGADTIRLTFNSDSGSNYASHRLLGDGSSAYSNASTTQSRIQFGDCVGTNNGPGAGNVGASVLDILDYANTNKYKTVRLLAGVDVNGTVASFGGVVGLTSGLWQSTAAITSITLVVETGINFEQYTKFGLFGIKGA